MQTTFEVAKLFHFHTSEPKINLLLRIKMKPKIISRNVRFSRKKRLETFLSSAADLNSNHFWRGQISISLSHL